MLRASGTNNPWYRITSERAKVKLYFHFTPASALTWRERFQNFDLAPHGTWRLQYDKEKSRIRPSMLTQSDWGTTEVRVGTYFV